MAARGAKAKRKSSSAKKKSSLSSARANKLAAFGFTGFLVLMAGAAAIALDLPAKAALSAGEANHQFGISVAAVDTPRTIGHAPVARVGKHVRAERLDGLIVNYRELLENGFD